MRAFTVASFVCLWWLALEFVWQVRASDWSFARNAAQAPSVQYCTSLVAADINGDGALDVVATYDMVDPSVPAAIGWLMNDGMGNLSDVVPITEANTAPILRVAHVNGDGLLDIVVLQDDGLYWLRNTGRTVVNDTQFAPLQRLAVFTHALDVWVDDLNGDGKMDAVVSDVSGVHVLLNQGGGHFSPGAMVTNVPAHLVQSNDLDGDGERDLVLSSANSTLWFRGLGAARFQQMPLITQGSANSIAMGDFRQVGLVDVVLASSSSGWTYMLNANGSFTDVTAEYLPRQTQRFSAFAVGDIDGDSRLDLVAIDRDKQCLVLQNTVPFYENEPATQFVVRDVISVAVEGVDFNALAVADIRGRGVMDVLVGLDMPSNAFVLYSNTGTRRIFSDRSIFSRLPLQEPTGIVAADFGRGYVDALFGGNHGLMMLENNGRGLIRAESQVSDKQIAALLGCEIVGSGRLDAVILSLSRSGTVLSWLRNDGIGANGSVAFTAMSPLMTGQLIMPACGDLTGDGNVDIVVAALTTTGVGALHIFPNRGRGEFGNATVVPTSVPSISSLLTVDSNVDGLLDILVSGNQLVVFLNSGSSFDPVVLMDATRKGALLVPTVADFNLDGTPDYAVGNLLSNTLHVLISTTAGDTGFSFVRYSHNSHVGGVAALAAGDITSTGWPSLCSVGKQNVAVCLISVPTDGSLDPFADEHFEVLSGTAAVSAGLLLVDVSGDGLVDAIVLDGLSGNALVNHNIGRQVHVSVDDWLNPSTSPTWLHQGPPVFSRRALVPLVNVNTLYPAPTSITLSSGRVDYNISHTWTMRAVPFVQTSSLVLILPRSGLTLRCCTANTDCTALGSTSVRLTGGPFVITRCQPPPYGLLLDRAMYVTGTTLFQFRRLCQTAYGPGDCVSASPVFRHSFPSRYYPGPRRVGGDATPPPQPMLEFSHLQGSAVLLLANASLRAVSWPQMLVGVMSYCHRQSFGGGALSMEQSRAWLGHWHMHHNSAGEGGAISVGPGSVLTMHDSVLSNNTAESSGGAIVATGQGTQLLLTRVEFAHNTANSAGGGVSIDDTGTQHVFDRVVAYGNSADVGGWMANVDATVHIVSSHLHDNVAWHDGGAVMNTQGTSLVLEHGCNITANHAGRFGGGIYAVLSYVRLDSSTTDYNTAGSAGGAVYVALGSLSISGGRLVGNTGHVAGAIYCTGAQEDMSTLLVEGTEFTANQACSGGAIQATVCNIQASSASFHSNRAACDQTGVCNGGAVLVMDSFANRFYSSARWTNCTFSNCSALRQGGAVWSALSTAASSTMVNCTFEGNRALNGGGGSLFNAGLPELLLGARFHNNHALYGPDRASTVRALVVAQNQVQQQSQQSGQALEGELLAELQDMFNQRVSSDSATTLTVTAMDSTANVLQFGTVIARYGYLNATGKFGVLAPQPGHTLPLLFGLFGPAVSENIPYEMTIILPAPLQVKVGNCKAGTAWQVSSRRCADCAPGTYSAHTNASSCRECVPGRVSGAPGATTCMQCQRPSYAATNRSTVCSQCNPGLYWVSSSRPCGACTGNRVVQSGACVCPPHSVVVSSVPEHLECVKCASIVGAYCPGNATNRDPAHVEAQLGFWRVPNDLKFLRCPFPSSCLHTGCTPRTDGPCCMHCQHNAYRSFVGECKHCPDGSVATVTTLAVVVLVILLGVVVLYMHATRIEWSLLELDDDNDDDAHSSEEDNLADDEKHKDHHGATKAAHPPRRKSTLLVPRRSRFYRLTALFKIVVGHIQILLLVVAAGGSVSSSRGHGGEAGFPQQLRNVAVYLGFGVLHITRFVPLQCLSSEPFVLGLAFSLCLPLVLLAVVALACGVLYTLRKHWWQRALSWTQVRHRGVKAASVLLVLVYPLTTAQMLETFFHRRCGSLLDMVGVDAGLDVTSRSYGLVQGWSIVGLLLYTVGIPLVFAVALRWHKDDLWNPQSPVAMQYAFLYQDLRPQRWWFFPVTMLEKVAYAVVVVFLSEQGFQQYTLEALLTFCSALSLAILRPYRGWYQLLLLCSRLIIFVTVFGAMVLYPQQLCQGADAQGFAESSGDSGSPSLLVSLCHHVYRVNADTLGGVLIALNCAVLLLPCAVLLVWWRQDASRRKGSISLNSALDPLL